MLMHELIEETANADDETEVRRHLEKLRWPDGFVCPACGNRKSYRHKKRPLIECADRKCKYQSSVTARTEFHSTKTLIRKWVAIFKTWKERSTDGPEQIARQFGIAQQTLLSMAKKAGLTEFCRRAQPYNMRKPVVSKFTKSMANDVVGPSASVQNVGLEIQPHCCKQHELRILKALMEVANSIIGASAVALWFDDGQIGSTAHQST